MILLSCQVQVNVLDLNNQTPFKISLSILQGAAERKHKTFFPIPQTSFLQMLWY